MKPNEETFILQKVKIKDGGLQINYSSPTQEEDRSHKTTCSGLVHPDLTKTTEMMRYHVAKIIGLDMHDENAIDQSERTLTITGVHFSVKNDETHVILSAKKNVLDGSKVVAVNTPLLSVVGDEYPDMAKLSQILDKFKAEVREYVFDGKRAGNELDFPQNEEEKEPEEVAA